MHNVRIVLGYDLPASRLMDVAGIILSVIGTAASIAQWTQQISERNETLDELAATVSRLSNILEFLRSKSEREELNEIVGLEVLALGSVLRKTLEHIQIWRHRNVKRSLLAIVRPSYVIDRLQEDARKLSQQTIELLFAFSAVGFTNTGRPNMRKWIRNEEVGEFWENRIGLDVKCLFPCVSDVSQKFFAPTQQFRDAMKTWFPRQLDDVHLNYLLLRLDEYNIGGVNVRVLDDFAGSESLQVRIAAYLSLRATNPGNNNSELPTPLLVWVDDNPTNVAGFVQFARDLGIHVVQFTSTGETKFWIDQNLGNRDF